MKRRRRLAAGGGSPRGGQNAGQHLEAEGNVSRGLKPLRRVFFKAVPDDVDERRRHARRHGHGVGLAQRIARQNRAHGLGSARRLERPVACQHLERSGTEREDVRPAVNCRAPDLLGRHIGHRANDKPRLGRRPHA